MKKLLALILALTMAACVFASCAPAATSTDPDTSPGHSTIEITFGTTTPTVQTTKLPDVPELDNMSAVESIRSGYENVDFGGHTFTFAAPINETDGWSAYEVCGEQDSAGLINDSIAKRNELLKKHYNANIKVVDINNAAIGDTSNTNGDNIDIVLSKYNLAQKGLGSSTQGYYNLHSLGIDFDKPWWDKAFINDTTINGKMYGILGAFSLSSFDATQVIYFNNTAKESNSALKNADFYDYVYNNEWTLDTFLELIRLSRAGGTTGYVSTSYGIRALYFGAGQGYIKKVDNSYGDTSFENAFRVQAETATDKIISIYESDATVMTGYVQVPLRLMDNSTIFATELLNAAPRFARNSTDFGILPFPKLTPSQSDYSQNIDNHMIYLSVAKSYTNIVKIAKFLDLYAYHSYYTVYKDYITTYGETFTGDEKATDMLDIILRSRYFDLADQYNWGKDINLYYIQGVLDAIPDSSGNSRPGPNPIPSLSSKSSSIISAANAYKNSLKGFEAGY